MIDALIPYVTQVAGVSLFLGVTSMLIGVLLRAFTGRNDGGRFF
jgi:hypothetical protein